MLAAPECKAKRIARNPIRFKCVPADRREHANSAAPVETSHCAFLSTRIQMHKMMLAMLVLAGRVS